jgi:O-antigen/teichoic acid export membrane protein
MRNFVRNLSGLYLVQAVNGLLGVAFVPFAVLRLGVAGYGVLAIYAVLAAYVVLVELGLGKGLVRQLGVETDESARREQLRVAVGLYICICALLAAAAPLLMWAVPRFVFPVPATELTAVRLITLLAVLEYMLGVPASVLQNHCISAERFERYSRYVLATGLLRYGLSFAAVAIFQRPEVIVAVIVLRRLGDVTLARAIMGPLPPGSWRPSFDRVRFVALLRQSAVLSIAQFFQLSVVAAGSILVNAEQGIDAMGRYRAVFDLASKVWFFSNVIGFVAFPRFVRLVGRSEHRAELVRLLPHAMYVSWVIYGVLVVAGSLAGPWALELVGLGSAAPAALFILVLGGVAYNAHASLSYEYVQASGRYGHSAALAALSLVTLVMAFYAFLPHQPALAVGWAWLVSQSICAVLLDGVALRALSLRLRAVIDALAVRLLGLGAVVLFVLSSVGVVPAAGWWLAAAIGVVPLRAGLRCLHAVRLRLAIA